MQCEARTRRPRTRTSAIFIFNRWLRNCWSDGGSFRWWRHGLQWKFTAEYSVARATRGDGLDKGVEFFGEGGEVRIKIFQNHRVARAQLHGAFTALLAHDRLAGGQSSGEFAGGGVLDQFRKVDAVLSAFTILQKLHQRPHLRIVREKRIFSIL